MYVKSSGTGGARDVSWGKKGDIWCESPDFCDKKERPAGDLAGRSQV